MILPRIQDIASTDGEFLLPDSFTVFVNEKYQGRLTLLANLFLPGCKISYTGDSPLISIVAADIPGESYRLNISKDGIQIESGNYAGMRNAMATLSMMATSTQHGYSFPCCTITDKPELPFRGCMLDLARGAKPFDELIADIVLLGRLKYNVLHLHIFDSEGLAVKMDSVPESCCIEGAYTKEQMRELVEITEALGMDIIPEWDMPGHSSRLFETVDGIECDIPKGTQRYVWAACPGTDKTYQVYEAIIRELCDLFPGQYFHIGADELHFEGYEQYGACHWDICPKCRKTMLENGLKDRQELYYYFVNRIYEIVKEAGRTMIMWSDQLDCNRPCPLSKDIIMHFWRVACEGRGPRENCSFNNQIKLGFRAINSHFWDVYFCAENYMNPERISDWRWDQRPEVEDELKSEILGSIVCVWEYGNANRYGHYRRTFAPAVAMVADKLWNGDHIDFTAEYEIAMTRAILGASTPVGLNIFPCFGSPLPPRTDMLAYFDQISSKEDISDILEKMKGIPDVDPYCRGRIHTYTDCVKQILRQL